MNKAFILLLSIFIEHITSAQSFRGLATLNDTQYFISGSNGNIWSFNGTDSRPIKANNIPNRDYRDIHAWDIKTAIAMSVADSGVLIKTIDGGKTWQTVFQETSSGVFFDVIEFFKNGKLGVLMGDPLNVDSTFLYFRLTLDSGNHWLEFDHGNWNKVNLKLNSMFAASGTSLRIINMELLEDTLGQEAVIKATWLIGGGGPNGASLRWVDVSWNLYGKLINETFFDIPLPLPEKKGWGVYSISTVQEDVVLIGGGHWEYPNGEVPNDKSRHPGVWLLKSKSRFLNVTQNDITLEPIQAIHAYISGIDLKKNGDYVAVGTIGKYQGNIYRNLWDVTFSPLTPGFKGYHTVSVKETKPIVIGSGTRISVLRF